MRTEREIRSLAYTFDWYANKMFTEVHVDGGIADVVFVSRARYLTEVEIKCSVGDFVNDARKRKWRANRNHVKRFFYAVPEEIAPKIAKRLPPLAGLVVIRPIGMYAEIIVPAPVNNRAEKISEKTILRWYENWHARTWQRILRDGQ